MAVNPSLGEYSLIAADLYFRKEDFTVAHRGIDLARRRAVSPAQVALAWLLHKQVTAAIIGATLLEHLDESVGALTLTLDDAEIEFLEAAYVTHPVLGHA